MRIVSMYDGMACAMLALLKAGIPVERYVAYEIDKYAVQTSTHNFPVIEHRGDVFKGDFTEFEGFDLVAGGSPCTKWSIAQTNGRETEASGEGWEWFQQYVRAIREVKPKFFIYENNKSMSKAIRASIDEAFGFEAVEINSKLVSAQNRQRLYWVGMRNEDGTYSKVPVEQPDDLGILLKDVLESGVAWQDNMVEEPVNVTDDGKSQTIKAQYNKNSVANFCCYSSTYGATGVAEPVAMRQVGRRINESGHRDDYNEALQRVQRFEVNENPQKTNCVSTVAKDNMVAEPVGIPDMDAKTGLYAIPCCSMPVREATKKGYTEIEPMDCVDMTQPNSKTRRGRNMAGKSNCCMTSCQYYQYCGVLGLATPCEWDESGNVVKAISAADGKTYDVYEVEDGYITIKGKKYPIKLIDGHYIVRKLTVRECMRLQTVPEWYEFPVSDAQAYKMLGNGWTVDVIAHLLEAIKSV